VVTFYYVGHLEKIFYWQRSAGQYRL
jgi:hypothetical protein